MRKCGTCTKCCEGHLKATIKGNKMYPGKPCVFVEIGKGCKDYETRPKEPCQNYNCYWKLQPEVPEHFKPEHSGVLMNWYEIDGMPYLDIEKAPKEPTVEILSWAIVHAKTYEMNMKWKEGNRIHWIGSVEFSKAMLEQVESDHATSPRK